jgi:transcriptional regulator with XRE-family HTH domain
MGAFSDEEAFVPRRVGSTQKGSETIGQRLGRLRKEKGITQVKLAEQLDITQSALSKYERGALLLHGELIVAFAKALQVSADEILGIVQKAKEPEPLALKDRRLRRRIEALEQLSKRDREAVIRTLDAFLQKTS